MAHVWTEQKSHLLVLDGDQSVQLLSRSVHSGRQFAEVTSSDFLIDVIVKDAVSLAVGVDAKTDLVEAA